MSGRANGNNRSVLGDLTNTCGKRLLPSDSQILAVKNKIARYDHDEGVKIACFVKESSETVTASAKGKEKVDCGIPGTLVEDDKGKEMLSLGGKQSPQSSILDFKGKSGQENAFAGLLPVQLDSSAHGDPNGDNLGHDSIAVCPVPQQCSKSSEYSTRSEDGDCLGDHETDSVDSISYNFLTEREIAKSAISDQGGPGLVGLKESQGDTDGSPCDAPVVKSSLVGCPNASESLDFKVGDMGNLLNASSRCGYIDMDSVGSCNCSFCLKALKRSKRLAMSLQGRICGNDYSMKTTQDTAEGPTELDLELTQHWKSLFLHTENVLVRETAQLHAALLRLKEFKEKYKRDLGMISCVPSSK